MTVGLASSAGGGALEWNDHVDGHRRRGLVQQDSTLSQASLPVSLQITSGSLTGATTNPMSVTAPAQLAFAAGSETVDEDAGDVMIQIVRSGGDSGAVSVDVATSGGTAVAGVNYTPVNQVLSFAAGQDSQTITIPVRDVGAMTSDLSVNVVLSSPSAGAMLGTPSSMTLMIHGVDQASTSTGTGSAAVAPLVAMDPGPTGPEQETSGGRDPDRLQRRPWTRPRRTPRRPSG